MTTTAESTLADERTAAMLLLLDRWRAERATSSEAGACGGVSPAPVVVLEADGSPVTSVPGSDLLASWGIEEDGFRAPEGRRPSSLDIATLTVSAWPTCGEAAVIRGFGSSGPRVDPVPAPGASPLPPFTEELPKGSGAGSIADPQRSMSESAARARRRLRRWCVANRADRLCTFTFAGAGVHDLEVVWRHVKAFRRDLADLAGSDVPIAVVPELHPGGHGWHVHAALGRFVDYRLLRRCWPHGFIDVQKIRSRKSSTVGKAGGRAHARTTASYLAKYITKGAHDGTVPKGKRRYSVPKGFQPERVRFRTVRLSIALDHLREVFGSEVACVWTSADAEDWRGPPTELWFALD